MKATCGYSGWRSDDEMLVGRHRVHADCVGRAFSRDARQVFRQASFDPCLIGRMQGPINAAMGQ